MACLLTVADAGSFVILYISTSWLDECFYMFNTSFVMLAQVPVSGVPACLMNEDVSATVVYF